MSSAPENSDPWVYKVFRAEEWALAAAAGTFAGSADDRRDGFIHLSTAAQLAGTLARHFAQEEGLVLAQFAAPALGEALRWEPSRCGALFPHLYAPLQLAGAAHWPLARGGDGDHLLPEDLA